MRALQLGGGLKAHADWWVLNKTTGRVVQDGGGPNVITNQGLERLHGDAFPRTLFGTNSILGNLILGTLDPIWEPEVLGIPVIRPNPVPSIHTRFEGSGDLGPWRFRGDYIPWASLPGANARICGGFWTGNGCISSFATPPGYGSFFYFDYPEEYPYRIVGRRWSFVDGGDGSHYYAKSRWSQANVSHPGAHGPNTHPLPGWRRLNLHTWSFGGFDSWQNHSCTWFETEADELNNVNPIHRLWVDYPMVANGWIWNANNFLDGAGNQVAIDLDAEHQLRLRYDLTFYPPEEPTVYPNFPIQRSDGTSSLHTVTLYPINFESNNAWRQLFVNAGAPSGGSGRWGRAGRWDVSEKGIPLPRLSDMPGVSGYDPSSLSYFVFNDHFRNLGPVQGSRARAYIVEWDLGSANFEINALWLLPGSSPPNPSPSHYTYLALIDPPVTKSDSERFRVEFENSWRRHGEVDP